MAVVLAFALAVAAAASATVYYLLASTQRPSGLIAQQRLLVASRDLATGALIRDTDLREILWSGSPPENAVRSPQDVIGRGVVGEIYKDEPIFAGRLAARGAGAGLAATIPLGKRAVALRVDQVVGVAGFVQPGMRVDVLVAGNAPGEAAAGVVSRTVLQNIEVLSAGQKIDRSAEGKPDDVQVVNLLVTPDQAEVLSLAASEMKVQLVLRNPVDMLEQKTGGASLARLFSPAEAARAPLRPKRDPDAPQRSAEGPHPPQLLSLAASPAPVAGVIEVYTGTRRTQQQVQPDGTARE